MHKHILHIIWLHSNKTTTNSTLIDYKYWSNLKTCVYDVRSGRHVVTASAGSTVSHTNYPTCTTHIAQHRTPGATKSKSNPTPTAFVHLRLVVNAERSVCSNLLASQTVTNEMHQDCTTETLQHNNWSRLAQWNDGKRTLSTPCCDCLGRWFQATRYHRHHEFRSYFTVQRTQHAGHNKVSRRHTTQHSTKDINQMSNNNAQTHIAHH
jgi:hypothetical protein